MQMAAPRMSAQMLLQSIGPPEKFLTHITFIRPLTTVSAEMQLHVIQPTKRFLTYITFQ